MKKPRYFRAANLEEVRDKGCLVVRLEGHTIALFSHDDQIFAVDNRCPHMGFPLHRGTVKGGILTCHWHHARFDLTSGGTFDLWADDVRTFPIDIRGDEVWLDLSHKDNPQAYHQTRLQEGLERNIPLVIAKAAINLVSANSELVDPIRMGLSFGARYRQAGWGQGLTIHACMINLLPCIALERRPHALYHGLSAIARECAGEAPRFSVSPLPDSGADRRSIKRWFRSFVEVRDADGAERCIVSAIRNEADHRQMADMLFSAVTDHRYIDIGHPLDFTNKAFEALDIAGWQHAEPVLASLASAYANADRMEESNAWRHPVDLVAILEDCFEKLPTAIQQGQKVRTRTQKRALSHDELTSTLLADNPDDIAAQLLESIERGTPFDELAQHVAYASAVRVVQFHTSNEFGDWDTALHTFTFANAVQQGLSRVASPELLRGVFDAAMSVYLDRFLNVPPATLPNPAKEHPEPDKLLHELRELLNQQQQVNEAGELVALFLTSQGNPKSLLETLGELLLREDRDFHTIQMMEASFRQFKQAQDPTSGGVFLIAAARYLAAHAPTVRAQGQTYRIAQRLQRGERLFDGD